jgi:hypothetical protein
MVPGDILLSDDVLEARASLSTCGAPTANSGPAIAQERGAAPDDERFFPRTGARARVHVDAVDAKGNLASVHAERRAGSRRPT